MKQSLNWMSKLLSASIIAVTLLGCQAEPGAKNIPFEPKKKTEKKLNDVVFNPNLDILFIIDDSISMDKYQQRVAENAKLFVDRFFSTKFINYHIGVTTSSLRDLQSKAAGGQLHSVGGYTFVDRSTPNGAQILRRMMDVGVRGSTTEQFFSIHMEALSPQLQNGGNKGFYRQDSNLAIFVITDSEDQSRIPPSVAFDFLTTLKDGDKSKLFYYAAIVDNPQSTSNCRRDDSDRGLIREMVRLHSPNSALFDICADDYGAEMAQVADDLVTSVSRIYLDQLPDVTTIKVTYGELVIPNDPETGWVYSAEENAIYLSPSIEFTELEKADLKINFDAIYK